MTAPDQRTMKCWIPPLARFNEFQRSSFRTVAAKLKIGHIPVSAVMAFDGEYEAMCIQRLSRLTGLTLCLLFALGVISAYPARAATILELSSDSIVLSAKVGSSVSDFADQIVFTNSSLSTEDIVINHISFSQYVFTKSANSTLFIGEELAPGSSATLFITFTPQVFGEVFGNVTISSNAVGSPATIQLDGFGLNPVPIPRSIGLFGAALVILAALGRSRRVLPDVA